MSALPALAPETRARHLERGRLATGRRLRHAQRRGYVAFLRVGAVVATLVLPLMLYVMLTANVTSLNYKLAHVQARKAALLAQTMRQDDRIVKLESRERLAALATRLSMHDPQTYAVVTLPANSRPAAVTHGIALLGAIDQWLNAVTRDITR